MITSGIEPMKAGLAEWSVILLCFSMAAAIGGGLYEHLVLMPIWTASPPSSFAIIQPGTGVPLQRPSSWQGLPAGRSGHGSENRWTSFPFFVFCWLFIH